MHHTKRNIPTIWLLAICAGVLDQIYARLGVGIAGFTLYREDLVHRLREVTILLGLSATRQLLFG